MRKLLVMLALLAASTTEAQVPVDTIRTNTILLLHGACVVADTNWPGIASSTTAKFAPTCPMIVYNPKTMRKIGWEQGMLIFALIHEFGHIVLKHNSPTASDWIVRQQEREADCYAAKELAKRWPEQIDAVVATWKKAFHDPQDMKHDDPETRAKLIRKCADEVLR